MRQSLTPLFGFQDQGGNGCKQNHIGRDVEIKIGIAVDKNGHYCRHASQGNARGLPVPASGLSLIIFKVLAQ